MPLTINHVHTATTPDITNQSYDILPQRDWNDTHAYTLLAAGSEVLPAFSNPGGPGAVFFGSNTTGFVTASVAAVLLSAGTQLGHAGTVSFGNSNNVTFGMDSNNVLTATVAPGSGGIMGAAAGTQSVSTGTLSFANSNNVSFGMSGSQTITASFSQSVQTQNLHDVTMGGNAVGAPLLVSSGTLTLAGGPNITLSQNGNAISISAAAPGGPAATGISSVSIGGNIAGAPTLISSGGFTLAGGNNITLSQNGSAITISGANAGGAQTGISGVTIGGNTAGVAGNISSGTLLIAGGNNITVSQNGNSLTLSGANAGGAQTGISTVQAGGVTVTAGQVSFANGNGVTFTGAGSTISASVAAQSVQTQNLHNLTLSGNTAGVMAQVSSGTLTLAGGNNITLSQNGNAITISGANAGGAQTGISGLIVSNTTYTSGTVSFSNANGISFGSSAGQAITASYTVPTVASTHEVTISGNTAGAGAIISSGTLTLAGGNNITLSQAGNAITISGANAGGAQTGISGIQVSNTTYTSGTVIFSNANNISFGSSAGGAVTASYSQSNQNLSLFALGNTTQNSSTVLGANVLSLNGLGEATVGFSNGSINISVPPSSIGISGGNTSNTSGIFSGQVVLQGGNNITLSGSTGAGGAQTIVISGANAGGAQTGISGIVVSNTTYTSGTVSFSNANGISFGSSAGQAITASYTVPTQTNQTLGLYASSQTTGQSSSSTVDARSLSIVGAGAISVGASGGSFIVSAPGTVALTPFSAGFSTYGNTAGNTGLVTGQLCLVGTNNITLSGSTNGGSITVSISGGAGGGGAATNTYFVTGNSTLSSTGTIANSSIIFAASGGVSAGISNGSIQLSAPQSSLLTGLAGISLSTNGSTISISGQLSTLTGVGGITVSSAGSTISISQIPIPRLLLNTANITPITAPGNASASIQYLDLAEGLTMSRMDALVSWAASSSATTNTCAFAISAYGAVYTKNGSTLSSVASGSTQTTYSYASNTAGQTQLITGAIRPISVPVNANLTPGEYWFAFNMVTATSSIGASTTNLAQTISMMGQSLGQTALNYAEFTAVTATSSNVWPGMGIYSAATTGLPAAISLSAINQTGSALVAAPIALALRNI